MSIWDDTGRVWNIDTGRFIEVAAPGIV